MSDYDKVMALVNQLDAYPKIKMLVLSEFGTVRLKRFLDELMADAYDTSGGNRAGFPSTVSAALISIALINQQVLEANGLNFEEDPVSAFAVSKWDLPRNF